MSLENYQEEKFHGIFAATFDIGRGIFRRSKNIIYGRHLNRSDVWHENGHFLVHGFLFIIRGEGEKSCENLGKYDQVLSRFPVGKIWVKSYWKVEKKLKEVKENKKK